MNNKFMEIYKNVVTDMTELCIKKNNDYGSSVLDTYDKFGDISYLTRITDKYNRILNLIDKENEVVDESIIDSAQDMANYLLLWIANKKLVEGYTGITDSKGNMIYEGDIVEYENMINNKTQATVEYDSGNYYLGEDKIIKLKEYGRYLKVVK